MLIDTHCHLNMMINARGNGRLTAEEYDLIRNITTSAAAEGVTRCITVGTTRADSMQCYDIAQNISNVFATIGLHPTDITDAWREDITHFDNLLNTAEPGPLVAIGECGIDLYHKNVSLDRQKDVFRAQIELALKHGLPLVVHSRDASEETMRILSDYVVDDICGVLHCFSYDYAIALDAIASGFVIGIGGTLTYPKNEILRHAVQQLPLHKIVIETDAPFLPPQPWRGQQNHPKYSKYIAESIAELKQCSFELVAQTTTHTATELFNLSD